MYNLIQANIKKKFKIFDIRIKQVGTEQSIIKAPWDRTFESCLEVARYSFSCQVLGKSREHRETTLLEDNKLNSIYGSV